MSDFASYKPVFIPEDDPSQFSFCFDTSQRRSCYVAPERFHGNVDVIEGGLTSAMDIFSLGCVIAELFLEGTHIFSLAQLFKYRKGEYSPNLNGIENENVRDMVTNMISLDPKQRLTATEYLENWRHKLFPDYFYTFLHDFISSVSSTNNYNIDGKGVNMQNYLDNRMSFIHEHFKDVALALGFKDTINSKNSILWKDTQSIVPSILKLSGAQDMINPTEITLDFSKDDGALIVLAVVLSTVRNVSSSSLKVQGCDLILALGEMINDEAKLDRCLPYFLSLIDDDSDIVQATAIRNMTQLLGMTTVITPLNGEIFSEYIFPRLDSVLRSNPSKSMFVRVVYASCFPTLAQIASRFLEMNQVLKTSGMLDSFDPETENGARYDTVPFDSNRQALLEKFEEHTIALLSDNDNAVRKALLKEIIPLCLFFGKQKTNDIILSHILTYLNDPDSSLKLQFFDCIIGLGPFIGPTGLEQYIQPLMLQALTNPEEFVTAKAFETYKSFSELGLIKKNHIWDLLRIAVRYTIHPNPWVRNATFDFISSSTKWMTAAEIYCLFYPIVRPFLDSDITDFSQANMISHAKSPLSRPVFSSAVSWAQNAQKSQFWRAAAKGAGIFTSDSISSLPTSINDISLSSEDEGFIQRFKEMAIDADDLWKVTVFREHLYRFAKSTSMTQKPTSSNREKELERKGTLNSDIVNLLPVKSLGIKPETYSFPNAEYDWDDDEDEDENDSRNRHQKSDDLGFMSNFEDIQGALVESVSIDQTSSTETVDDSLTPKFSTLGNTSSESGHINNRTSEIVVSANGATVEQSPATTKTVITQVYGTVEQPALGIHRKSVSGSTTASRALSKRAADPGNLFELDPYVSKLLDSVHFSHFRAEPNDFGPQVAPVIHSEQLHNIASFGDPKPNWKPTGVLASQFSEHESSINKIEVSPDHSFFLTCSDDGTVKIWDCSRLEKNVINRSVQTYKFGSTKVKFICFMENSYTFAASCSNGSVEFIRIEVSLAKNGSSVRFRKFVPIRKYNLESGEYVTWMKHVKTNDASLLIMATSKSKIIGLDVNILKEKFVFKCPPSHGIPLCFVVDSKKCWLLVGTSHGILDLYDLRFSVLAKTWTFKNASPIRRLFLRPKSKGLSFCMLGGTSRSEASIWNITTMACEEVYSSSLSIDQSKSYYALNLDEGLVDKSKFKFSKYEDPATKQSDLLCMAVGIDSPKDTDKERQHIHIITGGTDRKIRFWDINSVESCSIVSGLTTDSGIPNFYRTYNNVAVKIVGERMVYPGSGRRNSNSSSSSSPSSGTKSGRSHKPTRTNIIASEQQELAKNHQASIVDVVIIHKPYQMLVSADRSGIVRVFI